jgi:hypothetical protein
MTQVAIWSSAYVDVQEHELDIMYDVHVSRRAFPIHGLDHKYLINVVESAAGLVIWPPLIPRKIPGTDFC